MNKYPKLQDLGWLRNEVQQKALHQIAEEIGCSYSAIVYIVRKNKIPVPKRTTRRVFPHKSINQKAAIKRDFPEGRFGKLSPRWKGGRRIANSAGYIMIYSPNHPRCTKARYVMEHILVAEKALGRYLEEGEIVHHINGNKTDNRPENLKVIMKVDHVREHFSAVQKVRALEERIEYLEKLLKENDIIFA